MKKGAHILNVYYVDIIGRQYFPAEVILEDGLIQSVTPCDIPCHGFMLPGFIDAHIHIESSMLTPSNFATVAVRHGTVATVSDPHEIANVLGVEGVRYMIEDALKSPLKFFFGAPSCVPATDFETAGARIGADQIKQLLADPNIWYLSEMMNFPGVLHKDEEILEKLHHARRANLPIDGHAPGLKGREAIEYIQAGITTDHECVTYEEALHKLLHGMKIIIREGSAAKNFDALIPLMRDHSDSLMFCSDDKHPDELFDGHINQLVVRAIDAGYDVWDVLRTACINPVLHYKLPVGQLKVGQSADFILVSDLRSFEIKETWISGHKVWDGGRVTFTAAPATIQNNFNCLGVTEKDLVITELPEILNVIKAIDGSLLTLKVEVPSHQLGEKYLDVLKIVVVNRYNASPPAVGYVQGFGLRKGAIASSVAHDSHNIVAVGVEDSAITKVINAVVDQKGGVVCFDGDKLSMLPLPIAGLMSDQEGAWVAARYRELDQMAKKACGSALKAPYMTLSFMALLVIPHLKLSDRGLFDVDAFEFVQIALE